MRRGDSLYFEDVAVGDEIGPTERCIRHEEVVAFCRVWGAPMPNRFTDEAVARETRSPGPIIPGIMSMALIAQMLSRWFTHGVLKDLDVVFRQVVPHSHVTLSGVVIEVREGNGEYLVDCDVYITNEDSGRLVGGKAVVSLPSRRGAVDILSPGG